MIMVITDHKCEVCGEQATYGVQDIQKNNNYTTGWVERNPIGIMHFFCEKHKRSSIEVDVTLSPIAQFFIAWLE
jgi:hypothetical protein